MKKINLNKPNKLMCTVFFEEAKFPSINSKALISMQLLHKRRRLWSKTEKNIAIIILQVAVHLQFMRKNGIILPGKTTVRRWLALISFLPDFLKHIWIR